VTAVLEAPSRGAPKAGAHGARSAAVAESGRLVPQSTCKRLRLARAAANRRKTTAAGKGVRQRIRPALACVDAAEATSASAGPTLVSGSAKAWRQRDTRRHGRPAQKNTRRVRRAAGAMGYRAPGWAPPAPAKTAARPDSALGLRRASSTATAPPMEAPITPHRPGHRGRRIAPNMHQDGLAPPAGNRGHPRQRGLNPNQKRSGMNNGAPACQQRGPAG